MLCDGCSQEYPLTEICLRYADGHEARYCPSCTPRYDQWVITCGAEEDRLNTLLDIFIEDTRKKVLLKHVPQDLPKRAGSLILG